MIRITSGTAKNKKLVFPEKTKNFRAAQDKVKLAIFAILTTDRVESKKCLDLFAGAGSLGLEALSRGAKSCDFVDQDKYSIEAIQKNIKLCKFESRANTFHKRVITYVANTTEKYDLIFADPFYDDHNHKFLFQNLEEILNQNGAIVFLHGNDTNVENQLVNTKLNIETTRRFGKSHLTIITH